MKKILFNTALCAVLLLTQAPANAREYGGTTKNGDKNNHAAGQLKGTEANDCSAGLTQFDMEINNVRARLLTGGDLWWDLSSLPEYEVPKGNGTNPLCSIFAGAIWISGLDAGGNLKGAYQRYRDTGNDFWPGPLDANGNVTQAVCAQYDRIFNVFGIDIVKAQTAYQLNGSSTTIADIPNDVLAWPAFGNQFLATMPGLLGQTFNIMDNTAPFFDNNNDGIYNPLDGDYPSIPCGPCGTNQGKAFGDQMSFCVFNDVGNIHTESNCTAIGVQVNRLAFAFSTTDDINNMTFYDYEIINKSSNALYQTYVSQWVDPDLGCYSNDYVGCDTARNLGVCYNGTADDPDCAPEYGYGTQLPAVGVEFFQGPLDDNGHQIGMSSFVYFTNEPGAQGDPITCSQFRNYQTGYWSDGSPFTSGKSGYQSGGPPTKFIFPGNPSDATSWSECQTATANILSPGDRRFVESSGPFTLKPGLCESVIIGVPWLRPPGNGVGTCPDFNSTIGPVADEALALFINCFQLLNGPDAPTLQIRELANELDVNLVNLKGSNNFGQAYSQLSGADEVAIDDHLDSVGNPNYTFRGYRLYQVTSPSVSATDLNDPTKAVQIGQSDIMQGGVLTRIINYVKDPVLGLVPTLEVSEANTGITASYKITKDAFAQGENTELVNNITYYYTAVAYAYNNYLPYNQANPIPYAQLLPYLPGRGNFAIYSAVPHIPDPRDNGTIVKSQWGEGVPVTRIEGQGNGGNNLELTPATVMNILNSGLVAFADSLTYLPGRDPIGFQITDPIALVEGNFMLQMVDSLADTNGIIRDTLLGAQTSWRLIDFTHNDTIFSDRALDRQYPQEIIYYPSPQNPNSLLTQVTDYGFSIQLGTPQIVDTIPGNYITPANSPKRYVYGVNTLQSSVQWADSTKQWLSFIASSGVSTVTDWIRSGVTLNDPGSHTMSTAAAAYAFDDNWYYLGATACSFGGNNSCFIFDDPGNVFNSILGGTWGPYCLTPNYANAHATAPAVPYVYGPGFKWKNYAALGYNCPPPQNTLDHMASVDVVITPNKADWSQCIVFETGEDETTNQGINIYPRTNTYLAADGAFKGQIRMAFSQDWHDPNRRDYLQQVRTHTGRSWFPGYAINVETGERLNIAFGESSDMGDQNGRDMLWDPTSNLYTPITNGNQFIPQLPYFGGKHFIYVMESKYDAGVAEQQLLLGTYDAITPTGIKSIPTSMQPFYRSLMWTCIPYLTPGFNFVSDTGGTNPPYIPYSQVTFSLRVEKPYNRLLAVDPSPGEDSMPVYQFSTVGLGATDKNAPVAKNALGLIRIVPNPYLAYSNYETANNTSTVYITNLPNTCTISIYSLDGTLIRVLNRAIGVNPATNQFEETSSGVTGDSQVTLGTSTSVSWDLTNAVGIPIASGIYLFHIEAPGIGQTTLKWFGALRPDNITNY